MPELYTLDIFELFTLIEHHALTLDLHLSSIL